jgi:hypothetical protein
VQLRFEEEKLKIHKKLEISKVFLGAKEHVQGQIGIYSQTPYCKCN